MNRPPRGLDGESSGKSIYRWADTQDAQNLRLAIAGQIPLDLAKEDIRVRLKRHDRDEYRGAR